MDAPRPARIRLDYRTPVVMPARDRGRRSMEPVWVSALIGLGGMALLSYGLLVVTFLATVFYEHLLR